MRRLATAFVFFAGSFVLAVVALVPRYRFRIQYLFGQTVCQIALRLLQIELTVRHAERLAATQPCVFIPNHQHIYDLFVVGSIFQPKTIMVGKKSIRWVPIFGWLFGWTGNVFIDRSVNAKAVAAMRRAHETILRFGLSVLIFPEGTRSEGRGVLPFKSGAFHLAVGTQLPLLPIAVSRLDGRTRRVIVEALEPIPTTVYTTDRVAELREKAHAHLVAAVARLDAEIVGARL